MDVSTVRDRVLATHDELLDAVLACADDVATDLGAPVTDGPSLATALERRLAEEGAADRLPAMLETAVAAAGRTLAAEPVAAPPYVAVTSRGPVLRGTLDDGRLVVAASVFDVEREPVRYVRSGSTPAETLDVRFER